MHTNARKLVRCRFGRLKVEAATDDRCTNGTIVWQCRCRCGSIIFVPTHNLTSGNTLSCGCWQREVSSRPQAARSEYAAATNVGGPDDE